MPVLTFRVAVPNATSAIVPVTIDLISQARLLVELDLWSSVPGTASVVDISKSGYRFFDRASSKVFVPDVGSQDNAVMSNPGEAGWAPIPPTPLRLPLFDQIIEGPPFRVTLAFFNQGATTFDVGGFLIVREPFIRMDEGAEYELLLMDQERRKFQQQTAQGLPMERSGLPKERGREAATHSPSQHSADKSA